MTLEDDPRWKRFNDQTTPCPCCGGSFNGIFDIGYDHPDPWPHGNREASGKDILRVGDDHIGTDLCALGNHRFVRAILEIPVIGTDTRFAFGPWASLTPDNFLAYVNSNQIPDAAAFQTCFAWLMNLLPGFDFTEPQPCDLVPGGPNDRPKLIAHEGASELAWAQSNGISFDRLLDIYTAAGQDIRPHLEA